METIKLRYQISLFGNYDEITPSSENMKFFIENFSDKGLIPNQIRQLSIDMTSKEPSSKTDLRLNLTDSDKKWDVKFNSNRIDIVFLNSNIGVIKEISKEDFLKEAIDLLNRINQKFNKSHKKLGFVFQYLIDSTDIFNDSKLFLNSIDYFNEKSMSDWSSRVATRSKLTYNDNHEEIVNVISEARRINQPMNIKNNFALFEGVFINIDINTLSENQNYRFQFENLNSIFNEMSKIEASIINQIAQKFRPK